jgi:hypothetical protein
MPNRDQTGPLGMGPRTGRRGGANRPLGSNVCTCPKCKHQETHRRATPCSNSICPKCGTAMQGVNCYNPA